ncbi:MAG: hypothetical protein P1P88_15435 [Bacteroidales bacterium]|nr:hypothetical protein [Bacteroidales bacterium]
MDMIQEMTLATIHDWLKTADAMVINTGAGMGIDSGLADYRGSGGQWGNVESETGKSVFDVVNPKNLLENPKYMWTFFGNRMKNYADTKPHNGFNILKNWIAKFELDYFANTSNIDGHFQKAGFEPDKIRELHGSIFHFQCSKPCSNQIWEINYNPQQIMLDANKGNYPTCPYCGAMSRPNIYMFRDNTFLSDRNDVQEKKFQEYLSQNQGKSMLVFEIGSGPHVQSIRKKTRMLGIHHQAKIVRINPKDFKIKEPHIGINLGALEALEGIDGYIQMK